MSRAFNAFVIEQGLKLETMSPAEMSALVKDFTQVRTQDDRTKQADKDSCDVNLIVKRHLDAGMIPQARSVPVYGDATVVSDLQQALDIVSSAREDFMALTSRQREAFNNDPLEFVDAAVDPAKADLFRELGLIPAKEAPPVTGGASSTVPT